MNQVFISLYLDEDVDVLVGTLIQIHGFDVLTTRDTEHLGATDTEQLAYAVSQGRTLMTHNRVDFENLVKIYFTTEKSHSGVIFATRRDPHEIAQKLLVILNQVTFDEICNQVRYI